MSLSIDTFYGGAHLEHHKAMAFERPIEPLPVPRYLEIALKGHRHEPALELEHSLLVAVGQHVIAQQALTQARDDWHAAAHAPYAGVIKEIKWKYGAPDGLVLACDADQSPRHMSPDVASDTRLPDWSSDALLNHLRSMGVVGLGGAKFPTAEKMRQAKNGVHTLVLNGVECEPYIACDEALMRSRPNAIILGARLLAKAVGAKHLVLAVEDPLRDSHGSVLDGFREATQPHRLDPDLIVELVSVPMRFPQGSEKQLIKTLTGQEVPRHGLPQDIGVVCCNVATAAATLDACLHHEPLTHRLVSVTGEGVKAPLNVYAPIGAPMASLIELAGGYRASASKLIEGGPVSGVSVIDDGQCIDKGTLCLTVLTDEITRPQSGQMPCINCGFCVDVCPSQLLPQTLFKLSSHDQHQAAQTLGLMDCIECGLCGEVCPSHLPLLDWYRYAKDQLRAKNLDQQRQALAKRRFEARNKRMEEKEKAREAKRLARAKRLEEAKTAQSEIEAAIARARDKKSSAS